MPFPDHHSCASPQIKPEVSRQMSLERKGQAIAATTNCEEIQ
jgi:hypothetical protein